YANLNGKKFGEYGVSRNGILLHGPRGTGKTFLAEAVAGEFKLKYLRFFADCAAKKWPLRGSPTPAFSVPSTGVPLCELCDFARFILGAR
ncbi:MAG: AAA family ATPase, partial [Chloroflexi bacterium]|nr:AAA family ATPase [Chloroflexota bacterium]